jgi:hypothetical protein
MITHCTRGVVRPEKGATVRGSLENLREERGGSEEKMLAEGWIEVTAAYRRMSLFKTRTFSSSLRSSPYRLGFSREVFSALRFARAL